MWMMMAMVGERDTDASSSERESQISRPRTMQVRSSWMVQKGMRTFFNQGEGWSLGRVLGIVAAAAAALVVRL